MTRAQFDRIKLAGTTARQNGKKAEANTYAGKASLRAEHEAWVSGWIEADRLNRGK